MTPAGAAFAYLLTGSAIKLLTLEQTTAKALKDTEDIREL